MLHGSADARLRLICLDHHLPLMPCRSRRHLGTHLPMPAHVPSAKRRPRPPIRGLCWTIYTYARSRWKVQRMHGAPVGPTEPRRPRSVFGGLAGMSLSISSSFTLNEIGAVILARVGAGDVHRSLRAASRAHRSARARHGTCHLQTATPARQGT